MNEMQLSLTQFEHFGLDFAVLTAAVKQFLICLESDFILFKETFFGYFRNLLLSIIQFKAANGIMFIIYHIFCDAVGADFLFSQISCETAYYKVS